MSATNISRAIYQSRLGGSVPTQSAGLVELTSMRDVLEQPNLSHWMRLALVLLLKAEIGSMTLTLLDGRSFRIAGRLPGPQAALLVRDQTVVRHILTGGNLSFAEAYLAERIDSPDLTAVVEWVGLNQAVDQALTGKVWYRLVRRLYHRLRGNSRPGSRRNIAYHYDLGNDFYCRWLDPGMTYSAAIFDGEGQSLATAQTEKYRRIIDLLHLRREHEVLEIGCGWGGFACYAARTLGCRITGITISREQYAYAVERVQREGLQHLVTIELRDYRDIDRQFDRVVSIEMFEAVGEKYWPLFFGKLHDALRPGGRAALQVITIDDRYFAAYRGTMDFVQRYIFPGGMLPSPSIFRTQARRARLMPLDETSFGPHYARTLRLWRERFRAAWPEIHRLGFDERFRRMWEYYLCYCEGGFRARCIDVIQIALARA